MFRRKIAILITISILLSYFTCACKKNVDETNFDSYWYGCCPFSISSNEGYSQNVCSNLYSDGFYYLLVYGEKINVKIDGPDKYYTLYKVDSDGNGVNTISLSLECLSTSDQAIVDNKLYCVGINNNEYIIDINSGDIINKETSRDTIRGYYSIQDGYVKLTESNVVCYSDDDNVVGTINIQEISSLNINRPFYEKDGKYYLVKNTFDQTVFYELNFDNNNISEVLATDLLNFGNTMINGDIVFSDTGVYNVDFDSESLVPITEWSYVDIKPAYKSTLSENNLSYGNNRFGKMYLYSDYEIELIIFNNIPADVYGERIPITIGGYDVSTSIAIKWATYMFNTSQDEYRVYLDEYWDKYPYTTGEEAQRQLLSMIKNFNDGEAPDIYYGSNFDYRYMYNSGLVIDMLPIIENDSEFSMNDLVPSIKDTVIDNGACYQIFSSFTFNGNFGLKGVYGDNEYTYSMLNDLAQKTGKSIRGDAQASDVADQILRYSLGELVDKSNGTHLLSVEELRNIVDYSIQNGISCNSSLNYIADMDTVSNGTYLMCRRFLRNIYELASLESQFNNSFVYLGFPSVYGAAHVADPDGLVAISSDTEYQEACWQFIKYMLSDEVQKIEIGYGQNPVVIDVMDEFCQYAENPDLVPESDIVWRSITANREPIQDWIISDYRDMVNSIDSVISYDWGVYVVICDEINSYYLQGKSVDAIAESLQSRLDIYVSENYG